MKKILSLALLALIIPQITFAAWWNPLSWFSNEAQVVEIRPNQQSYENQQEEVGGDNSPDLFKNEPPIIEPKIIEKEVIKEVPVEKIITKIVPVDRIVEKVVTVPDQTIIAENILLKNKLKELESQPALEKSAREDNSLLRGKIKELEERSRQCFADNNELKIKIKELEAEKITLTETEQRKKDLVVEIAQTDLGITQTQISYDNCYAAGERCNNGLELKRRLESLIIKKASLQVELSRL